jgi:hypothetical protein
MWKSSIVLAAPLACAILITGCSGGSRERADQAQPQPNNPGPATPAILTLSGCLGPAPDRSHFVLEQVTIERRPDDAQREATRTAGGITENSWVDLDGTDHKDELTKALGQRVRVTGTITDPGENTIGTAGTQGTPTHSGDKSQAGATGHYAAREKKEMGRIARESMANGTAALVKVTGVQPSGEQCPRPAGQ